MQATLARVPRRTLLRCHRRSGIDVICGALLSSNLPLLSVWVDQPMDEDAFARVLRSSIARGLGTSFGENSGSFSAAISVIEEYQMRVGPFRLVSGWAETNWHHIMKLLATLGPTCDAIVVVDEISSSIPLQLANYVVVDGDFLRLTESEALLETPDLVEPESVLLAHEQNAGNYLDVLSSLLRLPIVEKYSRTDEPERGGSALSPGQVIDGLIHREMWGMAFDYACQLAPDRIPGFIDRAGDWFFNRGEHEYIYARLSGLPNKFRDEPKTAYWGFAAACAIGKQWLLMPRIRRILHDSEAPELRSTVAMAYPGMNMLSETAAAISALEAPITLRAHGFALGIHGERDMPIVMFREAMRLADMDGAHHLVVACGIDIAQHEIRVGNYREAIGWARWALGEMRRREVVDVSRKLSAKATLAFATLLVGEAHEAKTLLADISVGSELIDVPGLEMLTSTLGGVDLVTGDLDRAGERLSALVERSPVEASALASLELVALKIAQRKQRDAEALSHQVFSISRTGSALEKALGKLIKGMVLLTGGEAQAESHLRSALEDLKPVAAAVHVAQAAIWVAISRLLMNDAKGALKCLKNHAYYLDPLSDSGWKLLAADHECLEAVKKLYRDSKVTVELRFLGGQQMRDGPKSVELSTRQAEILTLLLLYPAGLTAEKLHSFQYGDVGDAKRTKVAVSRLRKKFPISKSPYKLETPVKSDFLEATSYIESGKFQAALNLYAGPLLPQSDAPAIVDHRHHLEESIRQAVLISQDTDALIQLGTVLDDDLEVWLAARDSLRPGDYRKSAVTARIRRIRSAW